MTAVAGEIAIGAGNRELGQRDASARENTAREPKGREAVAMDAPGQAELVRKASWMSDLWQLTKPRIVMMVLVTTVIAAIVASPSGVGYLTLLHLWLGVAMVAGSAGAMNQVWEREIDGRMARTRLRPLPDGRLSTRTGFCFAALLGILGTLYLWQTCGTMPALVGIATWLTYVPIYTPLKRHSSFNTTVGAVSGALPVLIGYTAAGGQLTELNGWLLFGVLAAWQYPHFMAIAWLYRSQYASAGFRMTTTVEPTGRAAGQQSVVGMLVLVGCLLWLVSGDGSLSPRQLAWWFAIAIVSYPMTIAAIRFARCRDDATARKLLRASLLQLPASLVIVTAAAILH